MRKNKKGFTLVELLAVIVILGILVVFTIPLMLKYINYSKRKSYIQDTKKLISIAEYKINSNSLKIEKPDPGNCIVLSYDYLNDGSINNPPGKGSYLGAASYVVVKNSSSGRLEYSAALIEEAKDGGYSGLMLSSPSQLDNTFGFSRVDSYNREDLVYINDELCTESCVNTDSKRKLKDKKKSAEEDSEVSLSSEEVEEIKVNCENECDSYKKITRDTINENFGSDYVSSIEKIYTEDELEQGVPVGAFSPKIVSAYVENGDINSYNSTIKMRVNLVASDKDSKQLNVCVKFSETDDFSAAVESCESYITDNLYVKEYTFPLDRDNPDKLMYFSISVIDENGNNTSTKVSKSFSKNNPPVVSASVSKRSGDKCNTYIASVHVNVSDDRDLISNLKYCINKSDKCNESDFMDHSSFFNLDKCDENGNNCTYDFNLDNGNVLDGRDYDIYLHVMDSNNQVTTTKLNYKVHEINPTVSFSLKPYIMQNKTTLVNYNSLSGEYDLSINGTCSSDDKIRLLFTSSDGISKSMTYADYIAKYSNRVYSFSGDYDGRNRIVSLNVEAEYGVNINKSATLNNVYVNQPPVIDNFTITSQSNVSDCLRYCAAGDNSCSSSCKGGNIVNVNFDVTDDIDTDFKYCISEDAAECDIDSNFKNLSDFNYTYSLYLNSTRPYSSLNSNRNLYLVIKDNMDSVSDVAIADYKLYENEAPVILGNVRVISLDEKRNINEVMIDTSDMTIIDDFDDYSVEVCYRYGGKNFCSNNLSDTLRIVDSSGNSISGIVPIFVRVIDGYGVTTQSSSVQYEITSNPAPIIVDTHAKSTDNSYNSNIFDIYFKVYDPDDTFSVCLSSDSNYKGCDYGNGGIYIGTNNNNSIDKRLISKEEYLSSENIYKIRYDSKWDYNRDTPDLYLYVVDSSNNLVKQKIDYTLYKMCSSISIKEISNYNPISSANELTYYKCGGRCYYDSGNPISFDYNVLVTYEDIHFGNFCSNIQKRTDLKCNHAICVKSALATGSDTYDYAIGNTFIPHNYQEQYKNASGKTLTKNCTGHYRLYSVKVDGFSANPIHLDNAYTIACAELVGIKYKIRASKDSSSDEKYIVIDDESYVNKGLKNCSEVTSGPCLEGGTYSEK